MNENNKLDEIILNKTITSLKKHFFDVLYINKKNDVLNKLTEIIDKNASIGYGGSLSLEEIGFFNKFTTQNYPNLLDRKNPNITAEQKTVLQNNALTADFFLSSANALSQTGELILIDKWGNRTGAMTYGPKKRIFIIGKNKIELDLHSAMERAQNKAAVLNNIRFDTKNPCTKNGKCMNCESVNRLCCITTIIHRCQPPESILIILVGENLGF